MAKKRTQIGGETTLYPHLYVYEQASSFLFYTVPRLSALLGYTFQNTDYLTVAAVTEVYGDALFRKIMDHMIEKLVSWCWEDAQYAMTQTGEGALVGIFEVDEVYSCMYKQPCIGFFDKEKDLKEAAKFHHLNKALLSYPDADFWGDGDCVWFVHNLLGAILLDGGTLRDVHKALQRLLARPAVTMDTDLLLAVAPFPFLKEYLSNADRHIRVELSLDLEAVGDIPKYSTHIFLYDRLLSTGQGKTEEEARKSAESQLQESKVFQRYAREVDTLARKSNSITTSFEQKLGENENFVELLSRRLRVGPGETKAFVEVEELASVDTVSSGGIPIRLPRFLAMHKSKDLTLIISMAVHRKRKSAVRMCRRRAAAILDKDLDPITVHAEDSTLHYAEFLSKLFHFRPPFPVPYEWLPRLPAAVRDLPEDFILFPNELMET